VPSGGMREVLDDGGRRGQVVAARTAIWAAGVGASPLAAVLARATGAELDRTGRVTVEPALSLPGHPEVLALGDMVRARTTDGAARALPGIAPWRCSKAAMPPGSSTIASAASRRRRSTTSTRATWPRSGAHARSADQRSAAQRTPRLAHVARDPPLLPDRLPEPAARRHQVGDQLPHTRPRRAAHRAWERAASLPVAFATRS
jgi:hypothetical protein